MTENARSLGMSRFPRPLGRGSIEAPDQSVLDLPDPRFPRPLGRGSIEANVRDAMQQVGVSHFHVL